jgi:nucleobase:cation symporter-1, NCS1 family
MARTYLHDPNLSNKDLAPVTAAQRTWEARDIAALWVGMAVCIPTYRIASDLLAGGLTWWQAVSSCCWAM